MTNIFISITETLWGIRVTKGCEYGWISIILGIFILMSFGLRWKWVINNYRVQRIYKFMGLRAGTKFYILLGLVLLLIGVLDITKVFWKSDRF